MMWMSRYRIILFHFTIIAIFQLLIALVRGSAKDHHIRLIPSAALDGRDLKWIKVPETKGCLLAGWGIGRDHYFACAIQKMVIIFQIDRSERRYKKFREIAMPGQPQCLKINNGRLFVGYPSSFRIWDLIDNRQICKRF